MPFKYALQIRDSPLGGKGLFALEDIPEGEVYWVYHSENPVPAKGFQSKENRVYYRQELQAMTDPDELHRILQCGIYLKDNGAFLVFNDGTQFTNHSLTPNSKINFPVSKNYREITSYALRDIKAGQEICENYEDYLSFDAQWLIRLMQQYNPVCLEFEQVVKKTQEGRNQP